MNPLEPPLHRPRACPACHQLSTAVVEGKCLTCRGIPTPPTITHPKCGGCGQPLLLSWPGRTHCARCTKAA